MTNDLSNIDLQAEYTENELAFHITTSNVYSQPKCMCVCMPIFRKREKERERQ
jgi:hypothetical protein